MFSLEYVFSQSGKSEKNETSETVFMARRIQFKMCQKMYRWCKDYLFEVLFRVKVCWWTLMNESLSSVPEVG